jgi:flagellar biogenesis protein FliO
VIAPLCALLQAALSGGAERIDADAGSAVFSALQAFAALLLVLAGVWYARRFLLAGGLSARRGERLKVEERLGIDLRNALLVVRVDERRFFLAVSDRGPARLIAELAPGVAPPRGPARAPEPGNS